MKALRIPEGYQQKIREHLKELGFKERHVKNALWSFEGEGVYVSMFPSGTLLIQGKDADPLEEEVLSLIEVPDGPVAGCDEAGKGDIFGPLVLCCAVICPENFREVLRANPKDSKSMKDEEVLRKAKKLRGIVRRRCINIKPERFNELYPRYGNLNRLMDAAYRKIVDQIRDESSPSKVVIDAYSCRNPFEGVEGVVFVEKGERDVAVSVASILARERFLRSLRDMEAELGSKVPKGASSEAMELARELLRKDPKLASRLIKLSFLK